MIILVANITPLSQFVDKMLNFFRYFQGNAIQDPEEEEGEVAEPGSKDKFDIKKILDFPGFNVPASSRYIEVSNCL